jgi:hypothetical protein
VNWGEGEWFDGVGQIRVRPGETITSRGHLAGLSGKGISVDVVRNAIRRLQEDQLIDVETTRRYTRITVRNYERYTPACYGTDPAKTPGQTEPGTSEDLANDSSGPTIEEGITEEQRHEEELLAEAASVVGRWNSEVVPRLKGLRGLPKAVQTDSRGLPEEADVRRTLIARLRDPRFRNNLDEMFKAIRRSDFLLGYVQGARPWHVTLRWLVAERVNSEKVIAGFYDPAQEEDQSDDYEIEETHELIEDLRNSDRSAPPAEFTALIRQYSEEKSGCRPAEGGENP